MLRLLLTVCVSALLASAAACGGDDEPDVAAPATTATTTTATAGTTESAAGVAVLPVAGGHPPELRSGRYRTRDGFAPRITFTVPVGWYGAQGDDDEGFGIGKGVDTVEQEFEEVGVFVHRLDLTVAQATSRFEKLELSIESAKPSQVGAAAGREYIVFVPGEHVILEPLGIFADIPGGDAEVTFVNVRGQTLMISIDQWDSEAARAEAERVVQSFEFPQ